MEKKTIVKIEGKEYNVLAEEGEWTLAMRKDFGRKFVLSRKNGMTAFFKYIKLEEDKIILLKRGERVPITVSKVKKKDLPDKIIDTMKNKVYREERAF